MFHSRFPLGRHRTTIQLASAVANFATTWRYLHDYSLPSVFLCLPVVLIVLPILQEFTNILNDPFTRNALIGVATGVNCGFLSTVANVYRTQMFYMEKHPEVPWNHVHVLELLHIPVLILVWIDSFLRLLNRLPTLRSLQVAALTALVADLLFLTCLAMLNSDENYNVLDATNAFLIFYIHALLLACLPLFRDASRAWILLLTAFSAVLQWQVGSLGVATWNFTLGSFPIPGFLLGLLYVFHCETNIFEIPQVDTYKENVNFRNLDVQNLPNVRLYWVVIALVFERFALHGIYTKHAAADTFTACLSVSLHGVLLSPLCRSSHTWRVLGCLGCCLSYLLHNLVNSQLYNPFILDCSLALCLVDLVNNSPPPKHEDLPRVKMTIY